MLRGAGLDQCKVASLKYWKSFLSTLNGEERRKVNILYTIIFNVGPTHYTIYHTISYKLLYKCTMCQGTLRHHCDKKSESIR